MGRTEDNRTIDQPLSDIVDKLVNLFSNEPIMNHASIIQNYVDDTKATEDVIYFGTQQLSKEGYTIQALELFERITTKENEPPLFCSDSIRRLQKIVHDVKTDGLSGETKEQIAFSFFTKPTRLGLLGNYDLFPQAKKNIPDYISKKSNQRKVITFLTSTVIANDSWSNVNFFTNHKKKMVTSLKKAGRSALAALLDRRLTLQQI